MIYLVFGAVVSHAGRKGEASYASILGKNKNSLIPAIACTASCGCYRTRYIEQWDSYERLNDCNGLSTY